MGGNNDNYCRSFHHISVAENLQIVLCTLRNLFFIHVIYCHLTIEVEASTRSQNVQQTPSDTTHYFRIMKVSI